MELTVLKGVVFDRDIIAFYKFGEFETPVFLIHADDLAHKLERCGYILTKKKTELKASES